ncbi:hypothetical protein HK098_001534 [Nowakowskiella sp. JEL0407]|nr:hypothetical protein HK098_001534 [Nowakowskiella sp. JEL0407]
MELRNKKTVSPLSPQKSNVSSKSLKSIAATIISTSPVSKIKKSNKVAVHHSEPRKPAKVLVNAIPYPPGTPKILSRLVTPLDIQESEAWLESLGGRKSLEIFNNISTTTPVIDVIQPSPPNSHLSTSPNDSSATFNTDSNNSETHVERPSLTPDLKAMTQMITDDVANAVQQSVSQLNSLGYVLVKNTFATRELARRLSLRLTATINQLPGSLNPSHAQILPGGRWQINVESEPLAAHLLDGTTKVLTDDSLHTSWTPHPPQLLVTLKSAVDQLWHRDFDMYGICGLVAIRDTVGPQFLAASHSKDTFEAYRTNHEEHTANQEQPESLIQQLQMEAGDVFVFVPTLVHRGVGTGSLRPMLSVTALARPKRGLRRKPELPSVEVLAAAGVNGVISFDSHSYL